MIAGFLLTRIQTSSSAGEFSLSRISLIKPLIIYGLPLYGSTILTVAVLQYNNIILANFASNVEIGSYAAARNLSTITLLVAMPIATVLYPSSQR